MGSAPQTTVTLADVARRAKVSPATASRVINGSAKHVAEDLRVRVLKAVEDLRYVPNAHAQSLARAQRSAVGVIVHDVSDPYFAEITRGLQRVAIENGRLLVICNSYRDPARELEYVEMLRANQVAAIVLAGSGYHDASFTRELNQKLRVYQQAGGRVAVIGRHELVGDSVVPANEEGAYLIGAHVFSLGHRHVAVVAGPKVLTTTTDRVAGLRRAARQYGRTLPARRIVYTDFTRDGGADAVAELMSTEPGLTAIVALNDSLAVGALAALRERGIAVPEAVSVTGFDDMPIARDVTPALTTVRLPLVDMGERAMTLALATSAHTVPLVENVAAAVVPRSSTAAPPT
jgi:LacI family transcriptional regulator